MDRSEVCPGTVILNNGVSMPLPGFGVYRIDPEETVAAVRMAVRTGYRLIDTAAAYGNERGVGEACADCGVARSELFVTSKLWPTDYGYDAARRAFDRSLAKLGMDYVDMYLLHWPFPSDFERTLGAWRALECALADGRVRAIGVCNHSVANLERLMAETDIVPAVNQVELHPLFAQEELVRMHRRLGIATQAWSPLGGVNIYDAAPGRARHVLKHPLIIRLAEKMGRTPAQIVLRWHLQRGVSAIPKSVRPERMAENFSIFDFVLSDEDMASITALDTGIRGGDDPQTVTETTYAVTID
ncbi:MAG: aldo/keto reductase [Desulfovibrionaceae bacterium]|nr:aldo/keto reductase [Desulfovibrionaceae bacterium]